MYKLNGAGKLIIAAVIAVAAIVLIITYGGGNPAQGPAQNPSKQNPQSPSAQKPIPAKKTGTPSMGTPIPASSRGGIVFSAPLSGASWVIGTSNVISWSKEGGVSGQIELLDRSGDKRIGVILNQIGPHQTSYAWNTRDIFLSRTSPSKTTVAPDVYTIRISWDGNNLRPITSQPITFTPAPPALY
jgi:hypothetical protein